MSHDGNTILLENLFDQYLQEVHEEHLGGIDAQSGEPWYRKTHSEMEAEAADLAQKHFEEMP
jgi:hypothetical protein